MQKNDTVKNISTAAEKLERALQAFETNMDAIRAERETLENRMYQHEHGLAHEWAKAVITPDALHYDFDSFTSGAVCVPTTSKTDWQKQRHAIMAALSASPFEDADRAEVATAQLDTISAAAAGIDAENAADVADAQKEMRAVQARYLASVERQKTFRRETIGRVRRAYTECARSCADAGACWGGYLGEGLDKPHTSPILSAVSCSVSVAESMDAMKQEINYHAEQAAARRSVPERIEFIKAETKDGGMLSTDEAAFIAANDGKPSGLRRWFGGMMK